MFKTIHTTAGLTAMTQAEASGTPINLTHMAVGDGNGNPVTPIESQSTLVREMYRATINRVFQDPVITNQFTCELVVPASVGGFVLREVGVFNSDGTLFAVGNLPETYKPMISEGSFADTIVRVQFAVTNSTVVNVVVNPSIAVATQSWVLNAVTACTIMPGGTTGQILRKATNGCGDVEWADPTDVNVVVDMIEEVHTLAAAQTVVTLAQCTTYGLAVYIEGVRLRGAQWTPDAIDPTKFTLATSYPAGTKLTAVQNEPAGSAPAPLVKSLNLSDVPDKALARTNLDIFSKAETRQMAPASQIAYFARNTAPAGWLKANGAAISRTAYADLFAAIGTTFGVGDGFNTFNLPDLRGEFVRGWDDARGIDASRGFGSAQAAATKILSTAGVSQYMGGEIYTGQGGITIGGYASTPFSSLFENGPETRPRNVALLACIKF